VDEPAFDEQAIASQHAGAKTRPRKVHPLDAFIIARHYLTTRDGSRDVFCVSATT
jgi:hypothetical protein